MGNTISVNIDRDLAIMKGMGQWGRCSVDAERVVKLLTELERAAFAKLVIDGDRFCGVSDGSGTWQPRIAEPTPEAVAAAVREYIVWKAAAPERIAAARAEEAARVAAVRAKDEADARRIAAGLVSRIEENPKQIVAVLEDASRAARVLGAAEVETDELVEATERHLAGFVARADVLADLLRCYVDVLPRCAVLVRARIDTLMEEEKAEEEAAAKAEAAAKTALEEWAKTALEEWAREHAAERFAPALDAGYDCITAIDDEVEQRLVDMLAELPATAGVQLESGLEYSSRWKERKAPRPEVLKRAADVQAAIAAFKAPRGYELTVSRVLRARITDEGGRPVTGVAVQVKCPLVTDRVFFAVLEGTDV